MNNSHIATAIAIRDLNCFTLETINDRILLQKRCIWHRILGCPWGMDIVGIFMVRIQLILRR